MCVTSGLFVFRILRIYKSLRIWNEIVRSCGILTHPGGFFRVAITGVSSGIGRSILNLLKPYSSVEVISCGRLMPIASGVIVCLDNPASVVACGSQLEQKWYDTPMSSPFGQDILINNAGVYNSEDTWLVNLLSPIYLTEQLASTFTKRNFKGRALRFVQVGSRLEAQSSLMLENAKSRICKNDCAKQVYADTKRGLLEHTAYLARKYSNNSLLSFCVVTPGMVNTRLGKRSVNPIIWWLSWPFRFVFTRHPIEGAVSVLWAAFGCPEKTGMYLGDFEILEDIAFTRTSGLGEELSVLMRKQFDTTM